MTTNRARVQVMNSMEIRGPLCPSTDISESTHVLGIRGKDGQLRMLPSLLLLPLVARDQLTKENLRTSVRLTGPCIKNGCHHWAGHCQLGEEISFLAKSSNEETISCFISARCRWRLENGNSVCRICTHIMREKSLAELEENVNGNR
jgi:hypothetical protein